MRLLLPVLALAVLLPVNVNAHQKSVSYSKWTLLDDGAVAEVGTHPELMEGGGVYRQLVERQFTEVPVLSS